MLQAQQTPANFTSTLSDKEVLQIERHYRGTRQL